MSDDLERKLHQLKSHAGDRKSEAGRFRCYHLIYLEKYDSAHEALENQRKIRAMTRREKEALIRSQNPMWKFLEDRFFTKD
jgi:putative endonuclease